jgi:hypothetical protein
VSVQFMAQWPVEGEKWPEIGESADANNANAKALLDLLGYNSGWPISGEADPDEFLARVRRAGMRAGNVRGADEGEPWTEDGGPGTGRARWVECGRRPGYFADKLPELEAVARQAKRHNGMVVWA